MELPFKYIVLCIIRTLNERNMPLIINNCDLIDYFTELIKKSYFTIEEKREICSNFDFQYELDALFAKYYQYFDNEDKEIIYDINQIDELDSLIIEEMNEFDMEIINDIDFVIEGDSTFLDIIGVKIKKKLYNFLIDIESEIEYCYNMLCDLESYVGLAEVNTSALINKIKKLNIIKRIMLLNTKNLLLHAEHCDLMLYASNIADKTNNYEEISLLLDDYSFGENNIMHDVFLRSIFTGSDSYISNLRDRVIFNVSEPSDSIKYSRINFYMTFLGLIDREIRNSNELLNIELVRIKYRIMNTMDSVYDTTLFMNNYSLSDKTFKEDYRFAREATYYFIKELLMYDDEQYRNKEYDTDNTMIYINSMMKKLIIETYYKLAKDKKVIEAIKENKLYGVNSISSGFLKCIVNKYKTKKREV